jgi:gamma-tubulin complex component 3
MVRKLLPMGLLYRKIKDMLKLDETSGLFRQCFVSCIQDELEEYYKLLALLEHQLDPIDPGYVVKEFSAKGLTLKKLLVWTNTPMQKLRVLYSLLVSAENKKGGQILCAVHSFSQHGDPIINNYMDKILKKVQFNL